MNPIDGSEASGEKISNQSARSSVAPDPSGLRWSLGLGCVGIIGLYLTSRHSYLLFHTLAELFTVVVAFSIFVIAWNSRRYIENGYLLFVGIAYLALGLLDLLHTLGYTGMPVFPNHPFVANQLWIAARFLESLSLLAAFVYLGTGRRPDPRLLLSGFMLVTGLIIASIFFWQIFPVCFVAGQGQTRFKILSEYAIIAILVVDVGLLIRNRLQFHRSAYLAILTAMLLAILTEAAFTVYVSNYGPSNMVGHYLKVFSYACIYVAIVTNAFKKPYELIFRELTEVNERLIAEVASHRTTAKERELAEGALRESEESYRRQFTDNTSVMLMIDPGDGRIRDANTAAVTFYGYSREQLLAMRIADINTLPGDKVQASMDLAMANQSGRFVFQHRLADGSIRDVEVSVSLIHLGNHTVLHSIIHDITERNLAEKAQRDGEARIRAWFDLPLIGICITSPTKGWLEVNDHLCCMLGYGRDELFKLAWPDLTHPEDLAADEAQFLRVLDGQIEGYALEKRFIRKDGSTLPSELAVRCVRGVEGNVDFFVALIQDITARKQAEKGLQETNELLTIFVRQSPIYTYIKEVTPTESRILQASENFEQMIGIKGSDMVGKTMAEMFPGDLAAKTLVEDLAVISGGKLLEVDSELNGRCYTTIKFPIVQRDKTLLAGFTIDITERRHLERTSRFLAQAEWLTTGEDFFVALGRFLAQHLAMDYVCIDRLIGEGLAAKTMAIWFDGHAEDNVEYALKDTPCGDVVGRTICCFPDGVRHQFPQDQVLQDMGAESYLGTTLWGSGGQPIGLIALIGRRPITTPRLMEATLVLVSVRAAGELERRDAEAKLNESLAFTHELIASMQDGFSVLDRLGVQLDVNPSFCRMTGFSREELVGVGAPYPYWPPEELETIQAALLETIKGVTTTFELIFMRKNGERFPVLVSPATIKDSQGKTTLFSATVKDITERNRAETSLRRHAQLAEAMLQLPRISEELDEQAFMQRSLALAENLTGSLVSFMHFVHDDEDTIELVAWSQRTVTNYCRAEFNRHYPVSRAGIWADAVRQRAAVVCNDYATYPGKKGLPEGHAELVRFVSVPVIENGRVVMLTGVGNRATNYDAFDLESVQQLSNDVWHIVQRRRDQQALQLTRFSVENAFDAMFWIRADASIADVNDAACRSLGYTREELLGLRVPDVDAHYDTEKWPDHFDELRQRGSMVFESEQIRRNGQRFSVEIVANYVKFGEEERNCAFVRDITERKQAEKDRANLQSQLIQSQKMESLGTLAGGVAHDMNNVLGAILGLASAHIGAQPYGSPLHQSLDTIVKATERGGKMVKSLLSFSRQSPAESQKLDMNAILREQVSLLERTTLAKVRLQINLEAELRPILGDASALTHAFMNLCVNAVDAMPENGTLTLHTRNVDNDWIEVVVEDTGTGMSEEVLEKAMEPFYTTKEIGKGTGLGLSMVFSAVKAHRGQMVIESEPGQGTRVRLRFPACEQETPVQAASLLVADATLTPHGSLKVLLVDDDDLMLSSVRMILEVLGHTAVATTQSGEEALAMLEAGVEPDLVILDMNMPGLGGMGTLPRLRMLRPSVPVLLSTGRIDQTVLILASAHPGVTLLPKPFGLRELQKHLEGIGLG